MKQWYGFLLISALVGLFSCGNDPQPELPDYLSLNSASGSGLVEISGGLTLTGRGAERLDIDTQSYSGVIGNISGDNLTANMTFGQPRPYRESYIVPNEYLTNGQLRIMNTLAVGTYPMGIRAQPTPTGAIADLTLNLPGPQLYTSQTGTLTISTVSTVQGSGGRYFRRIQGRFTVVMNATGLGAIPGKDIPLVGSFDLLFAQN